MNSNLETFGRGELLVAYALAELFMKGHTQHWQLDLETFLEKNLRLSREKTVRAVRALSGRGLCQTYTTMGIVKGADGIPYPGPAVMISHFGGCVEVRRKYEAEAKKRAAHPDHVEELIKRMRGIRGLSHVIAISETLGPLVGLIGGLVGILCGILALTISLRGCGDEKEPAPPESASEKVAPADK